jgi:hypothetical protein
MGLTVCTAESADVAELAKKLPTGRLYSTGRGFVPAVGRSLYGKLVEQLKLAGKPVPDEADQPNGGGSTAQQVASGLPTSWEDICCRPPGDRPRERNCGLVGGHRRRPGRGHASAEMA